MVGVGGDIDPKIYEVSKELGPSAYGIKFDISSEDSVRDAYRDIIRQFGGVDVVFNNAVF